MAEAQPDAAAAKGKPKRSIFKDLLKQSNFVIALTATALFIFFTWYTLVLKPALDGSSSMSIKLTKKPLSQIPFSQALNTKPEVEPQLSVEDFAPSNKVVVMEEKVEQAQQPNPTQHTEVNHKKTAKKIAKAKSISSKKVPPAKSQQPPRLENDHTENIQEANVWPENVTAENKDEEIKKPVEDDEENEIEDEDSADKIKSFAAKWKESIKIPATQSVCTQVQIALHQCPN